MKNRVLRWTAVALAAVVILVSSAYLYDMNREYKRIRATGTVIPSPYGDIEYTEHGSGPSVLVIHGSGGGYDQGELIAQIVLGEEFHSITPSRFGYLRSTFNEGAAWEDQALAYAYLLDYLGIEQVAVVAMSHGGPSALHFAILQPERVSSLTLVPAVSLLQPLQTRRKPIRKASCSLPFSSLICLIGPSANCSSGSSWS